MLKVSILQNSIVDKHKQTGNRTLMINKIDLVFLLAILSAGIGPPPNLGQNIHYNAVAKSTSLLSLHLYTVVVHLTLISVI